MKLAIVAVGYNRPKSMLRLLSSLMVAEYDNDVVDLVISLDKSECQKELLNIAESIEWEYGEKHIRAFPERQGLRPHILQCGQLTNEYDAVVVLEDDIVVSKGFYSYCKQMIKCYNEDERIAGISLYKFYSDTNGLGKFFIPAEDKNDVFFMQKAQSWGQCWTKRMWDGFETWYKNNQGEIVADESFPEYIANWNQASWLKYYDKYVSETNKFYVYPYKSLTTNHMDAGEHATQTVCDYQVPLLTEPMEYRCVSLDDGIKYDIFFERIGICDKIFPELKGKKMLDLMGIRKMFGDADYLFSTQALPYKVIKELKLQYRPMEDNLLFPYEGEGIFIYDLHERGPKPKSNTNILTRYYIRSISWKKTLLIGLLGLCDSIKRKLKL